LLIAVLAARAEPSGCPGPDELLQFGSDGNARALAHVRHDCLSTAPPPQRFLIYLASYMAEPKRFKSEFVNSFPIEEKEWPALAGVSLNRYFKGPYEFFLASELVSIAETGHREALRKLVRVSQEADGAWSEILLGGILECLIRYPSLTLQELNAVAPPTRESLLADAIALELSTADAPKLISAVRRSRLAAPRVADDIERLVAAELSQRHQ
jgi:hypothetical protein